MLNSYLSSLQFHGLPRYAQTKPWLRGTIRVIIYPDPVFKLTDALLFAREA